MKKIIPSFKKVSEAEQKTFSHSDCLLTVSVGQETHEDKRFGATMQLIEREFRSCIVTLHDSLQRYTMALAGTKEPKCFWESSIRLGDSWLKRNAAAYKNLQKPPRIIRWSEWLDDPDFADAKARIVNTMADDRSFQIVFDETVEEYLSRYCQRLDSKTSFDRVRAGRLCIDYLIEECAVLCLWYKTGCQFELYAGNHNQAMEETRKRFITPCHSGFVRSVKIGFNYRPNLQPQQLNDEVVG